MPARQPKPEPHHCPPWCHECPGMTPPGSVLPWCPNGDLYGLEGCICSHDDPHLDANTIDRANWFAAERLREAVRKGARPLDELSKRRRARP